jgi:hypothetical protein
VSDDGSKALLRIEPLSDPACAKIVVHLGRWASADPKAVLTLDPKKAQKLEIPIH